MEDGSGRKFTYRINVVEPGFRLRIGLDKPEIGDVFNAQVYAPGGGQAGSFGVPLDLYSQEAAFSPRVGEWRIVVEAQTATDTAFRLRAKLEKRLRRSGAVAAGCFRTFRSSRRTTRTSTSR